MTDRIKKLSLVIVSADNFIECFGEILEDCGDIIDNFIEEYPVVLNEFLESIKNLNYTEINKSAHSLKGITSMLQANEDLVNVLKTYMICAKESRLPDKDYIERIKTDLKNMESELLKIKDVI